MENSFQYLYICSKLKTMTTLRISITKEVLEATKDCESFDLSENCAISYAIKEIWPHAMTVAYRIYPFFMLNESHYCIDHNQQSFINTFDRATPAERARMQPFSFEIEVPDEVIGEVNIEEIRDIIKNSKTLELV